MSPGICSTPSFFRRCQLPFYGSWRSAGSASGGLGYCPCTPPSIQMASHHWHWPPSLTVCSTGWTNRLLAYMKQTSHTHTMTAASLACACVTTLRVSDFLGRRDLVGWLVGWCAADESLTQASHSKISSSARPLDPCQKRPPLPARRLLCVVSIFGTEKNQLCDHLWQRRTSWLRRTLVPVSWLWCILSYHHHGGAGGGVAGRQAAWWRAGQGF